MQFSLATRWQNARLQALGGAANATARVHQAFRRRSGGLVAGGKCATAKADAPSGRHLLGRCKIWAGPLAATFGSTTKLMELLKEVAPQTNRVALMFNPATSPASGSYFLKPVEAAAPLLKMAVVAAPVHNPAEIEPLWCRLRASRTPACFAARRRTSTAFSRASCCRDRPSGRGERSKRQGHRQAPRK